MNSQRINTFRKLITLSTNAIKQYGFRYLITTVLLEIRHNGFAIFKPEPETKIINTYSEEISYKIWLREHELGSKKIQKIRIEVNEFKTCPKITIILNVKVDECEMLLQSLQKQLYKNFEIIINCQKLIYDKVVKSIKEFKGIEIIENKENCDKINELVSKCSGEWILLLNNVKTLTEDALYHIIVEINSNENIELIYSDEDRWLETNRINPFFKPDWSPDLFLSQDYISNFFAISKKIWKETKFDDSLQYTRYYDFLLKITDKPRMIKHITKILYSIEEKHDKVNLESKNILKNTLQRRRIEGEVLDGLIPRTFRIKYKIKGNPKISIIIPTKDNKLILQRCLDSLRTKTDYKNFEVIIIDNNSETEEMKKYLNSLSHKVLSYKDSFNFSKLNNLGRKNATGEFLLFLNDDIAALKSNWLENMIEIGQQEGVGVVGAKLVLSDNNIQHAGWVYLKSGAGIHPFTDTDAESDKFNGQINVIRNYSAVTGACQLIKTEIYDKVGGYDENFDLYYGDSDLCMKVIEAGYRIVYTPYAKLLHQGSTSIKKQSKVFFSTENHLEFITKWKNVKNGDPFYNPNLKINYRIKTE